MVTVSYQYQFEYAFDLDGKRFPRLGFRVLRPESIIEPVDVQMYLDIGAERSLLNGWVGAELGLDVLAGPRIVYQTGAGAFFSANLHRVRFSQPDLGDFDLEIGFSTAEIPRNLLGRDFFDLVQVGFREHRQTFFVTPDP